MKYTEKQILEKANKVIKDLGLSNKTDKVNSIRFNAEKELARGKDKGKKHPCWIIFIDTLFDNTDILTISDQTGEPLYYQSFNMEISEIKRDTEGDYSIK